MLSTTVPQLIHISAILISLFAIAGAIASYIKLKSLFLKETPTKSLVAKLRGEVAELSGELGDLQERFTRFQRKEGMREARAAKQTDADLIAEASQLMQQGAPQAAGNPKLELWRRRQ